MMSLRITHLAFIDPRWYLRFAGSQDEFQEAYAYLKKQPYFFAHWTGYAWPDGKEGAWWIHGKTASLLATSKANVSIQRLQLHMYTRAHSG